MPGPRTWNAFAGVDDLAGDARFLGVDLQSRMASARNPRRQVVEVVLTEDPEGRYRGWLPSDGRGLRMIQPDRLFAMQFPYGPDNEVRVSKGEVVSLRVEQAGADDREQGCH